MSGGYYVDLFGDGYFDEGPFESHQEAKEFGNAKTIEGEEYGVGKAGPDTYDMMADMDFAYYIIDDINSEIMDKTGSEVNAVDLSYDDHLELNALIRDFIEQHNKAEMQFDVVDINYYIAPSFN